MSRRRRSQPVVIAEREVSLGGRLLSCVVKRSLVARQVRFEIREGGILTVVLPRRCSLDAVDEMVQSKSRWILGKMDAFAGRKFPQGNGRLKAGDAVPYLGEQLRIAVVDGGAPGPAVELVGQTLMVRGGRRAGGLEPLVEAWYRAAAAAVLRRKVQQYAADLGVSFSRFSIRGQRTRWGSCSHKGTLSFNWRLMMAPEPVADYVVIHEVAHLREMNHTGRFWRLVAERCPSWREHRKWLNDHGAELSALLSTSG
jgi:predicted metal-dependent hydrolase